MGSELRTGFVDLDHYTGPLTPGELVLVLGMDQKMLVSLAMSITGYD